MKDQVYEDNAQSIEVLKNNIQSVIGEIKSQIGKKSNQQIFEHPRYHARKG